MRQVLEQIAGWPDDSSAPVLFDGRQLLTRVRFSRMLESACRHLESLDLGPGDRCALELRNPTHRLQNA